MALTYFIHAMLYNILIVITVILLTVTVVKYVHDWFKFNGKKLPPKAWRIPVLGNVTLLHGALHKKLMDLEKQHGDVFRINLVGQQAVVLNSFDAIKQAYLVQGKQFSGVPKGYSILQWLTNKAGLFQEDGPVWQADRRFTLHTFRDFGVGTRLMQCKIQNVARDLIHIIQKENGRPCNIAPLMHNCTTNVICSVMFDKHYDLEDPEFQQIQKDTRAIQNNVNGFLGFFPLGPFIYVTPSYWKMKDAKASMMKLSKRLIQEHQDSLSMDSPRDYVEAYLQRLHQLEMIKSEERKLSMEQLIGNGILFLLAGVDTTEITVTWALWLMILHPKMQEKIWKEIESTVGTEQLPDFEQREMMPFLDAFVMEVQRYCNTAPVTPFHRASEETTLKGFTIPKDMTIVANLWAAHRDRKCWTDPETFNPYRFLDKNGTVVKNEALIPFSIGKRVCVGESLARMEIFVFIVGLLQKFAFKAPDGVDLSNLGECSGFLHFLEPFKLCAVPRTQSK